MRKVDWVILGISILLLVVLVVDRAWSQPMGKFCAGDSFEYEGKEYFFHRTLAYDWYRCDSLYVVQIHDPYVVMGVKHIYLKDAIKALKWSLAKEYERIRKSLGMEPEWKIDEYAAIFGWPET